MKDSRDRSLFLNLYFALIAGFAHSLTTHRWASLTQEETTTFFFSGTFSWQHSSLIMAIFFIIQFLTSLFPLRNLIRYCSFLSFLLFLWAQGYFFRNAMDAWLFLSFHFLVCFFPQLIFRFSDFLTKKPRFEKKTFSILSFPLFLLLSYDVVMNGLRYAYCLFFIISCLIFLLYSLDRSSKYNEH